MTGSCSLSSLEEMTSVIGELGGLIQNLVHIRNCTFTLIKWIALTSLIPRLMHAQEHRNKVTLLTYDNYSILMVALAVAVSPRA